MEPNPTQQGTGLTGLTGLTGFELDQLGGLLDSSIPAHLASTGYFYDFKQELSGIAGAGLLGRTSPLDVAASAPPPDALRFSGSNSNNNNNDSGGTPLLHAQVLAAVHAAQAHSQAQLAHASSVGHGQSAPHLPLSDHLHRGAQHSGGGGGGSVGGGSGKMDDLDRDGEGDDGEFGRGSSPPGPDNKRKRAERSREASRDYRQRKKAYIEELECKLAHVTSKLDNANKMLEEQKDKFARVDVHRQKYEALYKLQERWRTKSASLELLIADPNKNQEMEATVTQLRELSREITLCYKNQHIISLDFSIFAHFALVGKTMYRFDGYGHDVAYEAEVDGRSRLEVTDGNFPSHVLAQWRAEAQTVFGQFLMGLNTDESVVPKVVDLVVTMKKDIYRLKKEHAALNDELVDFIRRELQHEATLKDVSKLVKVNSKLLELKKNYEQHWTTWENGLDTFFDFLTPRQSARLLVRRIRFLEHSNILNSMWLSLNRQAFQNTPWLPSFVPPIPLPVHMSWPFFT